MKFQQVTIFSVSPGVIQGGPLALLIFPIYVDNNIEIFDENTEQTTSRCSIQAGKDTQTVAQRRTIRISARGGNKRLVPVNRANVPKRTIDR